MQKFITSAHKLELKRAFRSDEMALVQNYLIKYLNKSFADSIFPDVEMFDGAQLAFMLNGEGNAFQIDLTKPGEEIIRFGRFESKVIGVVALALHHIAPDAITISETAFNDDDWVPFSEECMTVLPANAMSEARFISVSMRLDRLFSGVEMVEVLV